MWIADLFAAPVRVRRIQAQLQRDPVRPTIVVAGVRWAACAVEGGPNEPHCESCYQKDRRLVPVTPDWDDDGTMVYVRCRDPYHGSAHWLHWIARADYERGQSAEIPRV